MTRDGKEPERIGAPPRLPARAADAHKGDFGRVLVVGGSGGMVGAVALAANAALRGGAGLVTFAAPEPVQLTIAAMCPCATSIPLAYDESGGLAREATRQFAEAASHHDVVAIGPGLSVGTGQQNLIRAALGQSKPLVIDADGLNNLALIDNWPQMRSCPLVLTPHPGEFARLTGASIEQIQSDRQNAAVAAGADWRGAANTDEPLVCVLKGAGTVVTDGDRIFVNPTGNSGMGTGGSGDVLTGLLAALIGQGMAPFDAAVLAVHTHGRAGDLAADSLGEVSLIASDLLDYLPGAIKEASS